MTNRLTTRFAELSAYNRAGFVAYMMAGDGDSQGLLNALPAAGADVIELGMPFTDPMADGPSIQASALRALDAGMTLKGTLAQATEFRKRDKDTPLVLMGYANPIFSMGWETFAKAAAKAGVDGLICVDIPPEEDNELRTALTKQGIALIRLATPTTDDDASGDRGRQYGGLRLLRLHDRGDRGRNRRGHRGWRRCRPGQGRVRPASCGGIWRSRA